jgi:putative transposase
VLEARTDLTRWLERWSEKHPKLCTWVEANIEETFTFFLLPREHHKHLGLPRKNGHQFRRL